ncbi:MAG: thioredoxin-disulfide reductase [candidate division WOR-3 bacterium]
MEQPEVLIVGAGPAGMTAGIYSARSGHKTLILEKAFPGGQVAKTYIVENYPGFAQPLNALDLVQAMEAQARRFGCTIETAEARKLLISDNRIEVQTSSGSFLPRALIIASGVEPKLLGVEGETRLTGHGVSYCATCDGPFFRGREVAVVGGGDSALEEALFLAGFCSKVYLIHRRDQFRAVQLTQDRVRKHPAIELILSSVVTRLVGDRQLEAVEVKNLKENTTRLLPVAGLFVYVGALPNTAWCRDVLNLDQSGYIITDEELRTSVPGIFAAGDVRKKEVRQIATAVGDGTVAAMMAHRFLEGG